MVTFTEEFLNGKLHFLCSGGNIFHRLIFNDLFKSFKENNPFSPNQSDFIPGDSCVQQLVSITHKIDKAFDFNPSLEVGVVFKAFDKVCHDGLSWKLECDGIIGSF